MLELLDGGEEHEHKRRGQRHQSARPAHGATPGREAEERRVAEPVLGSRDDDGRRCATVGHVSGKVRSFFLPIGSGSSGNILS
jgi:hypothetical protein